MIRRRRLRLCRDTRVLPHPDVVDDYKIMMKKPRVDEIVSFLVKRGISIRREGGEDRPQAGGGLQEWPEHS